MKKISIIGAGFSGLAAAAYAAKAGYEVDVFEKNEQIGGRARQLQTANGYVFDMGPSWYWMPDVFERFFNDFGKEVSDYYNLKRLDPQFEIIFSDGRLSLPGNIIEWYELFEEIEPGSAIQLKRFLEDAAHKYEIAIPEFVEKPCKSITEFFSTSIVNKASGLQLFSSMRSQVKKYFRHPWLISIMEFPVIFLGASPSAIPAMYNLLNFGGYNQGTFYPMGGFGKVISSMADVALSQGVRIHTNASVEEIVLDKGMANGLRLNGASYPADGIIASADYHFSESLLPESYRNYKESYWDKRTFAPSCLIFYIGLQGRLNGLQHHTLFFEHDLDAHISEIYTSKTWPRNPLFYVCCPSQTDDSVAPEGNENLFILMPIATGLADTEQLREEYLDKLLLRLEKHCKTDKLKSRIDYLKTYCVNDFIQDYNAYGGNAYGLANTLRQTAFLKPKMHNKKVKNLLYTGQLTVPGPGVPPSIISGKIAAQELNKILF